MELVDFWDDDCMKLNLFNEHSNISKQIGSYPLSEDTSQVHHCV